MGRANWKVSILLLVIWLIPINAETLQSTLSLVVKPGAFLEPGIIQLEIPVRAGGPVFISETVLVRSRVRALPNQQISLTAAVTEITGPDGTVQFPAIKWECSIVRATGGGTAAACTAGTFQNGSEQPLISGWTRSGIVDCSVTLTVAVPANWAPGLYTGSVNLHLRAE